MKKLFTNVVILLVVGIMVAGNILAARYQGQITQYLCGFGIDYNTEEYQEKKAEASELAVQIAEEGIVLLKNESETLPLSNPCINVFGWGGCDNGYIYMGFGSGTASTYGQISLYDGLRDHGFELNETLVDLYNSDSFRRKGELENGWAYSSWKLHEPLDFLTDEVMDEAQEFSDTALVVISRFGMEGYDLPKYQNDENGNNTNNGRSYLEISPNEEALLEMVTERFENVIVIINSANAMELGFLDNENIDAALNIYFPGNNGSISLAKILSGEVTPSGHLVDTFAYDHSTSPSYANTSTGGSNRYSTFNAGYIDYAENIYYGYYWYETAEVDGFWDSDYAKEKWGIENGYSDVVQYPFGYGLSYAEFEWSIEEINLASGSVLDKDEQITIKVYVKNVSQYYSGQDVIQLYYTLPYYEGGIEKPAFKLGAFAKTTVLDPGEGEFLTLTLSVRDMASYDCYDKNINGFMGYELDGGEYSISLRTDAHTIAQADGVDAVWTYSVPESGYRYETDEVTGTTVTNLFTTYTNPVSGASSVNIEESLSADNKAFSIDGSDSGQNIVYMTREDFVGTFPASSVKRDGTAELRDQSWQQNSPLVNSNDQMPITGSTSTNYTIDDMLITDDSGKIIGMVDYNDPKWDDLINQLSLREILELCGNGGLHTIAIDSIKKPACKDSDGPSGFNTTIFGSDKYGGYAASYPCEALIGSTWNWKMAYMMGCSVAGEAEAAGIDGWYGPACNIHRSPYGGRNFEYYSEDPFLSGVMVAKTTLGAKENGLYSYVKHFVANETEANRAAGYTWLTEQTLREIYLLPFEYAVKDGETIAIMSSYNRIGSTRTSGSYNLLTSVLRDEWGFEGCVVSDYNNGHPVLCPDEAIRAGNDLMMEVSGGAFMFEDQTSATAVNALHRGAKNIIYCYVAAQYSQATSQGLDLSAVIGNRTESEVFAWWIPALAVFDGIVAIAVVCWFVSNNKRYS